MTIAQIALEYFEPDYLGPKELIDMANKEPWWFIFQGVYLGYSVESIKGFIKRSDFVDDLVNQYGDTEEVDMDFVEARRPKHIPSPMGTPFEATGYVPTETDLKKGYMMVVKEINSRRFAPHPFPDKRNRKTGMKDIIKMIKNNPRFVDRLNEVISEFSNIQYR